MRAGSGPAQDGPVRTDGLGRRVARGAGVTLLGQGVRIGMQLGSVVVLARLLTPADYGLFAIVLVVVGIGEIFRDFGLSTAAIRAPSLSTDQRDTLAWVNAGVGALLTVIVYLGAGLVAAVFGRPELVGMAHVLCLTFLVNGLATQYRADLTRRLRFGRLVAADTLGQAVGLTVAITSAAVLDAGYWALVAQQLTQVTVAFVVLGLGAGWLPGRPRRSAGIGSFLRLGTSLVGTQLLGYLRVNLDTITLGLRTTPTAVGTYTRAFQLLMTPLAQLRSPTTTVALPVLTRMNEDRARTDEFLRRAQLMFGYTVVAAMAVAAGGASPLLALFLGDRWVGVAPVFALLAVAGSFQTLSYVGYWVYLSRGLGTALFRYSLVSLGIQAVCIVVGSSFGVVGVATGYAVATGIEWPLSLWWLSRITPFPGRDLARCAARILACALPAGLAALAAASALGDRPALVGSLAAAAAGLAVYGVAWVLFPAVRRDVGGLAAFGAQMVRR